MPQQFLRDIADIMAERPLREGAEGTDPTAQEWLRQPDRDFHGIQIWKAPDGQLVGVASPELRRKLKSAHQDG